MKVRKCEEYKAQLQILHFSAFRSVAGRNRAKNMPRMG
jgi:hypothetical protein